MNVISRKVALANGLPKYYTGKPCKNGHTTERYTSSATCQDCINGERVSRSESPEDKSARTARALQDQAQRDAAKDRAQLQQQEQQVAAAAAEEAAQFLTVRIFIVPDDMWPTFKLAAIIDTQMAYPALRESDIVPKKYRLGPIAGLGKYMLFVPESLYAQMQALETALQDDHRKKCEAAQFAATPGALRLDDLSAHPTRIAYDEQEGHLELRAGRWYRKSDGDDLRGKGCRLPFIAPLHVGFFPRARYSITRSELLKHVDWNGTTVTNMAEMDDDGEHWRIEGDWFRIVDVGDLLRNKCKVIYSVEPA